MAKEGWFVQLPPAAKGILAVAATVAAGFGVYWIYKGVKKIQNQADAKEELNLAKDELSLLNKTADKKQTLSAAKLSELANSIFTAMDGAGTDSIAISKKLIQLQNQADWLALQKAYGVRTLNSGIYLVPDFSGTLSQSLTNELGSADAAIVKALNAYFKQRGINVIL